MTPKSVESSRRVCLAKVVSWRIIVMSTTIVIACALTRDLGVGASIGGVEATANTALYDGHERAWTRLQPL